MFSKLRLICTATLLAAGIAPAAAQEIVFPASLDPSCFVDTRRYRAGG